MKVDYLSVHFKTSIIPSRTKHESFNSFGSHAQLLNYLGQILIAFFYECNEPILFIVQKMKKKTNLMQNQNT